MKRSTRLDDEKIRALYINEHLTLREIGKRVGKSFQAVHQSLKRQGVEMRPQHLSKKAGLAASRRPESA